MFHDSKDPSIDFRAGKKPDIRDKGLFFWDLLYQNRHKPSFCDGLI
jgi:hypothetical protein